MPGALDGLRVVEVGDWVTAPFCARLLADLGAHVTKVESSAGDSTRDVGGMYPYLNAGKHGTVLDLDDPAARDELDEILASSDILVENVPHADRERWRLGFAALGERFPALITVSISPYGRTGPWADKPGTDLCAQAAASLPYGLGVRDRVPLRIPYDQADYQAGLHAAAGALCALYEKRRSGRGQAIDIATAQVLGYLVGGMHRLPAKSGRPWQRQDSITGRAPMGFFECADGFVIVALQKRAHRDAFDKLMGRPPDADFFPYLMSWMKERTRRELLELALTDDKVVLGIAQRADEILASPQYAYRELWADSGLRSETGEAVVFPKPAYRMSATPVRIGEEGAGEGLGRTVRAVQPSASSGGDERRPALEGVRILEFGWNWAGPMCGQLLADMGAEVIRIETEKRQDEMRFRDFASWFFCNTNRSKLSTTINVAGEEGAALVRELAAKSDIVVDNLAAGVMARNGLGYEDLRKVKEDLIVVSMSMAGQEGPERGLRGFASIATAYSGLELMIGYPEDETSTGLLTFGLGDTTVAVQGTIAVLAALDHRDRTGEGQFVDVSQIDAAVATLAEPLLEYQLSGEVAGPQGNRHPTHFPHGLYPAAGDDRWLAVAVTTTEEWAGLARVLGRGEWADEPSLASAEGRRRVGDDVDAAISDWTASQERDAAVKALWAEGVPSAPLLELPERDSHPQFGTRGFIWDHTAEGWDPCFVYGTPWLLDATPAEMRRPAPLLGEHNEYVWKDLLGLGDSEIERLRESGVLG